jgi:hypothetical protein
LEVARDRKGFFGFADDDAGEWDEGDPQAEETVR